MRALAALSLLLSGCDLLFPEFSGTPPDAASGDGGAGEGGLAGPHLTGSICALADVRDFRSCMTGFGAGFRVTVEETRDATTADAHGNFTLMLSRAIDHATVAAIDPSGGDAPTIVVVALSQSAADGVALPVVSARTLDEIAALNSFAIDPSRGTLLAWTVDAKGNPIAGAAAQTASAVGPLYEGGGPNVLTFGDATGARGALALFSLAAPQVAVAVSAPRNGTVNGDQFTLQARPGAVTMTTLLLPSK